MGPILPAKKLIKPTKKMKQLHWTVVQPLKVGSSVWANVDDEKIKFDVSKFENKFSAKVAASRKPAGPDSVAKSKSPEKKQEVTLLDPKRSYNINIVLARFRKTNEAIRDAVMALDETVLNEENCSMLVTSLPTAEELEIINSFDGDPTTLGKSEKFFVVIKEVPDVVNRCTLFLFKLRFAEQTTEIGSKLKLGEGILKMLRDKQMSKVLATFLALGNYLNGGTKKGQAHGFAMATIGKFKNTKSTDDKSSLLHFAVELMEESYPEQLAFFESLLEWKEAARVELQPLKAEIGKVSGAIKKLGTAVVKSTESATDAFHRVMSKFMQEANPVADQQAKRMATMEKDIKEVAEFFGEDPAKVKFEELVELWLTFAKDTLKAKEDLERWRKEAQEAEKREKRANEMKAKKGLSPEGKSNDAAGGKLVDNVMGSLTRNSSDIRNMIRQRRAKHDEMTPVKQKRALPFGGASIMEELAGKLNKPRG